MKPQEARLQAHEPAEDWRRVPVRRLWWLRWLAWFLVISLAGWLILVRGGLR